MYAIFGVNITVTNNTCSRVVLSKGGDLQEERQEVMNALLELDCIPSGMELFPAANVTSKDGNLIQVHG